MHGCGGWVHRYTVHENMAFFVFQVKYDSGGEVNYGVRVRGWDMRIVGCVLPPGGSV